MRWGHPAVVRLKAALGLVPAAGKAAWSYRPPSRCASNAYLDRATM